LIVHNLNANLLYGKDLSVEAGPMAYQLVGEVKAYQGYDE
jgi:hypothetical protein